MDWADLAQEAFMWFYTLVLVIVSIYGLHRYVLVYLYYRHRKKVPQPKGTFDELPRVTVQLPMFNERFVARRIIEKTCLIDYPKDKMQIQVLDDSIDDTCEIAKEAVEEARDKGFDIEYIHRTDRTGYKAGALENGLKSAKGEFVTIFDADFVPKPDILKRSVHHFTDPDVCVVQTRWDHLNRNDSLLTRSQAIYLDGHFAIEHVARNRSQRFMSFNGTAGTWRIEAIRDAGGWEHDTLTEDLDLSYRAQLKGWKFVFLPELTAPAELPPEMMAFKAQQFRWTKGGAQTALKLLPTIMKAKVPLKVKIESFFHLTGFSMHIYMLALVIMMLPAMFFRCIAIEEGTLWRNMFDLGVFA
ncbi:MAG: cellulose synthase family protein, partial [Phycisphaerae bacterium]